MNQNYILSQLNERKALFQQFELSKLNDDLVLLGHGGGSLVYEMHSIERPDCKFALKVIGFDGQLSDSDEFDHSVKIQWILSQESRYVASAISIAELSIELDASGKVLDVWDIIEKGPCELENRLHLQFVLMEKLDAVLSKDRFKNVFLLRPELENCKEVLKFALEIGQALGNAHSNNFMHRDVKLENVFWDDEAKIYKLGDFGTARFSEDGNAETVIYTGGYGAPEIERRLNETYSFTADIYSFGITLYLLFNDLKFPGSEGYYSRPEIQYNPDYVFPAPAHASEEIARVIRKMCSYNPEDRYQSIYEALSDLIADSETGNIEVPEELFDMPTETYHEATKEKSNEAERQKTRAERKEDKEIVNILYREDSIKYGIALSLIMVLLFLGMQGNVSVGGNWLYIALPIVLLFEALFQTFKEFNLFFGVITVGIIGLSILNMGITVSHIIMLLFTIIGCPVLTVSCALATGVWTVLNLFCSASFIDLLWKYDLGWIILIAFFIVLNQYFMMRIDWEKTTRIRVKIMSIVYDKSFPVMIFAGVVLLILQHFGWITIPELIRRMHFIRTGIVSLLLLCFLWWHRGLFDDDENALETEPLDYTEMGGADTDDNSLDK